MYNQPNVHLADLKKAPIKAVTTTGIDTQDGKSHDLDTLIFATGFDAITGSFSEIDFRGQCGRPLLGYSNVEKQNSNAIWVDHKPKTSLPGYYGPRYAQYVYDPRTAPAFWEWNPQSRERCRRRVRDVTIHFRP